MVGSHDELAGEMGDGPEQEQDGQAAGDGAHAIDGAGGGEGVIAEQDDKKAAHENKEGGAGRVGYLELIAAGDEFPAVPETAGGFHSHHKHCAGDKPDDPAGDPIQADEAALSEICHIWKKLDIFFSVQTQCR